MKNNEVVDNKLEKTVHALMMSCMQEKVPEVFRGNTHGYFTILEDPEVSIRVIRKNPYPYDVVSVFVNRKEVLQSEFPLDYKLVLETGAERLAVLLEHAKVVKKTELEAAMVGIKNQGLIKSYE